MFKTTFKVIEKFKLGTALRIAIAPFIRVQSSAWTPICQICVVKLKIAFNCLKWFLDICVCCLIKFCRAFEELRKQR